MLRQYIQGAVRSATQRHGGYIVAAKASLDSHLLTTRAAEKAVDSFWAKSLRLSGSAMDVESRATEKLVSDVLKQAELSNDPESLVIESQANFIALQATSHIKIQHDKIARHFDKVMLAAVMRSRSASDWPIVISAVTQEMSNSVSLGYRDRAGKKWTSARYVEVLYASALYELVNDRKVEVMAKRGRKTAWIDYPNHDSHGQKLALVESQGLQNYNDLKAKVFHPGSEALITDKRP